MFCYRSLQLGHTRLEARIAAWVCRDIAFRVPVLLNVPNRIFHYFQPLAKNGFIHIERRIHSNHVFVIGNRPYTVLEHLSANSPRRPPVFFIRVCRIGFAEAHAEQQAVATRLAYNTAPNLKPFLKSGMPRSSAARVLGPGKLSSTM